MDAGEWFFKAHFFQDPVQPGSLGIEAMCQLLQFYPARARLGRRRAPAPGSSRSCAGREVTWKYRGQVTPANRLIRVDLEITETGRDERGPYALADAWLWGDDVCIYHARGLGMRVVSGDGPSGVTETTLDPAVDRWTDDHRPTWTVPALPMMSVVDRLAQAASDHTGRQVVAVRDVQLRRWIPLAGPVRLRTEVAAAEVGLEVRLLMWREAATPALSRFEEVAGGTVLVGDRPDGRPSGSPRSRTPWCSRTRTPRPNCSTAPPSST